MASHWRGSTAVFAAAGLAILAAPGLAWSATDAAPDVPSPPGPTPDATAPAATAPVVAPSAPPPAAAAASTAPDYDPFEHANRRLYRINQGLDKAVIRPLALGYKAVLPSPVRTGVRNVISNINEPNTVMNDVLQAKPERGAKASARFVINSTVGVLGLFDVAGAMGLPRRDADFGQTLGRWGLQPGPYFYLPVLGPSDMRDGLGRIVDSFTGLLNIHDLHVGTAARVGVAVIDGLDTRAQLDPTLQDLNKTATDPYVTVRSVYLQNRQSMITDTPTAINQLPSFDAPPPATAQ